MSAASSPDARDVAPAEPTTPAGDSSPPRRWTERMSLRTRLLAVVTSLLVVALVATGVLTVLILEQVLVNEKDQQLQEEFADPNALRDLLAARTPQGRFAPPTQFYLRWTIDGEVAAELPPGDRYGDGPDLTDAELARVGVPMTVDDVSSGGSWRVLSKTEQSSGGVVTLALPTDDVQSTLARVTRGVVLVGLLLVLACGLLGWEAVRRSFRPLRQVEDVTAAFGGGDTSRRVENAWPGTEVGRLGSSVNAMLDRIETTLAAREASEARMRRFVGDASHELRTPLAAVRGFAELYRMGAVATDDDVRSTFRRIEQESTRMGGLVDDLLLLARMDERRPMRRDPLDLLALAADAVQDARALAPDRVVELRGLDGSPVPSEAPAIGDDAHLRQVLTNLVANAVRHTPAGTPVEVGVGRRGEWVLWQVVDHGAGIDPEQSDKIFERFFRADASRSRATGGGSGLGLAIVSAIVDAHAGAARVTTTPGGGATFEVALPAADVARVEGPEDPEDAEDAEDAVPEDGDPRLELGEVAGRARPGNSQD